MNIIIFEDKLTSNLKPFSFNHATFEVKTGMFSNIDRFKTIFRNDNLYLIVRKEIEEIISEKYSDLSINPEEIPKGFCINGKVVWRNKYNRLLNKDLKNSKLLFYNNLENVSIDKFYHTDFFSNHINDDLELRKIDYLWDAIDLFDNQFNEDFNLLDTDTKFEFPSSSHFIQKDKIKINKDSIIRPGCVLDAEKGPIVIKSNVIVDIGSKIQGPVFIDDDVFLSSGANIKSKALIGPGCKVGGEISNTIFHANSNKVHDGFLGHSYVGEWVNIGAGTNNSNLKNNYSTVKFSFGDDTIDTKRLFLGCMIGDYTRIGISSMLNTGTFIGIGSNVFGAGFQNKFISPFSWGKNNRVDFEKFIDTCINMKKRRHKNLSNSEKNILEKLYNSL